VETTAKARAAAIVRKARQRQRPEPLQKSSERRQHDARGGELAGGRDHRVDTAETFPDHGREAVGEGRGEHGEGGRRLSAQPFERREALHRDDAQKADEDAQGLLRRHRLVARQHMRDEEREDGRGGVQDRRRAGADPRRGDDDEREGDRVVDKAHQRVAPVDRAERRTGAAGEDDDAVEENGRQRDPHEHQREDRNLGDRDLDEQEGRAPQHREEQQFRPGGRVHAGIRRRHRGLRNEVRGLAGGVRRRDPIPGRAARDRDAHENEHGAERMVICTGKGPQAQRPGGRPPM
jgi:hypothetical protein